MRSLPLFFVVVGTVLIFSTTAPGQISNLYVNGSSTYFGMTSGDFLSWAFNLPAGGKAGIEVWIDVDGDTAIDPSVDRILTFLQQVDGSIVNEGGIIPDFDGIEDGAIHFGMSIGIAPGRYVLRVSHGASAATIGGLVQPLPAPAFTISGTVSGPPGADLSYLLADLSRDESYPLNFWNALTDSQGHYTIEMGDDTAGNPWWLGVDNPPRGYLLSPAETTLTITGNHAGVDFELVEPGAQVGGYVLSEDGDSLRSVILALERMDPGWAQPHHWVFSDYRGSYWAGIYESEMNGNPWRIVQPYSSEPTTTTMLGMRSLSGFPFDLVRNITVYRTNATIEGSVRIDGDPPGFPIMMFAQNDDTARAWAWADPATGRFSIPVSDRISLYFLRPYNLLGPYFVPVAPVAPGDTGVAFDILLVGVEEEGKGVPSEFALTPNFPNPFNPVTEISYALPERVHVTIEVYTLLGARVALLADGVQEPGYRRVTFDGTGLPAGVYLYRMTAGSFTAAGKMLLVK